MSGEDPSGNPALPRRDFLRGAGAASAAMAGNTAAGHAVAQDTSASAAAKVSPEQVNAVKLSLRINGKPQQFTVDPRVTLVDLLREHRSMTGTKKGCDHGSCGACTVHVNGKRVLSCLTLAVTIEGADVQTIEGLASGDNLHPMQEAFLRCDAYQCGYCTPGQIMSGVSCIEEGHANGSAEETREWMSGNLCRCSAYPNIVAAVRQTAGSEPVADPAEQAR